MNGSLHYQIDFAHLFFPTNSLIVCDSAEKIFLYASEFIWLPLSVTSVESTEPVQRQPCMLQSWRCLPDASQVRRCALLFLASFIFGSVLAADERLASCSESLYFSCINPLSVVNYVGFTLGIWRLSAICFGRFNFFFHSCNVLFFHQSLPSSSDSWILLIAVPAVL